MFVPFQTILVAIDKSDVSQKAFDAALTLAKALSARLMIVHVLNPNDIYGPHSFTPSCPPEAFRANESIRQQFEKEWIAYAQSYESMLKQKTDDAIAAGVDADFAHPRGFTGATLCEFARTTNVSLMVVGSHQRRGMAEIMLGSVSNYVMHHAPCSVMVIYANDIANTSSSSEGANAPKEQVAERVKEEPVEERSTALT